MKKKLLISLFSVVLLAGCSLFGESKPDPVSNGVVSSQENFDYITTEMHEKWTDKLVGLIPAFKIYNKSKNSINAKALINAPETGEIQLELGFDGTTDTEKMLSDNTFSLKGSMDMGAMGMAGQQGTATAKFSSKNIDKKMFFSLAELNLDLGGQEAMIEPMFEPYVGVWYGGTMEELNNLLGVDAGYDFQTINPELLNFRDRTEEALKDFHIWKLKKGLETKDGMLYFEVELDKVAVKKGLMALADVYMIAPEGSELATQMEEQKTEIEKDIDDALAEIKNVSGTLAISQDNEEYFTFSGKAEHVDDTLDNSVINIEISWLENNKKVQIGPEGAADDEIALFEMTTKNDTNKFTLSNLDKSEVLLDGESSDDKLKFTFIPEPEYNNDSVNVDLNKKKGTYSGTITIPENEVVINVNELKIDENYIKADFEVTEEGTKLASISVEISTEELKKVEVKEPETYKSFEELLTSLQGLMFNPTTEYDTYDMDYEDINYDEFEPITIDDMEMYQ